MLFSEQPQILWDTNIIIDFLEYKNIESYEPQKDRIEYFDAINKIWSMFENNEIEIFASVLAIVESVNIDIPKQEQVPMILRFFDNLNDNVIAISRDVAECAHKIRAMEQISLCQYDSIHLACAQFHGIPIVITNDNKPPKRFLEVDKLHKTISTGYPIRIIRPQDYISNIEDERKNKEELIKQQEIKKNEKEMNLFENTENEK